jgi:single-stranded-DNA-specific exonuclease
MGRRQNPGIAALAETAQIEGRFEAYHCGFILGPRVNAGGRIGSSMLGAILLSSDDPVECLNIAQQLDALNRERQTMEKTCTQMAIQQVDTLGADKPACFAVGDDWHEGIIGIVASRMKDAYDKPAICLTDVGEGLLKGSARSMAGFDLGAAIIEARNAGLLVKGGGHPMAGGVTLERDKLEAFESFICAKVKESPFGETGVVSTFDAKITVDQVSIGLADSLVTMEPFGVGNPKPRFIVANALVEDADMLLCKKTQVPAHLRVKLRGDGGRQVKAMAFHVGGTELAQQILNSKGRRIDIAGTLSVNEWQGRRSAELMIDDARASANLADANHAA